MTHYSPLPTLARQSVAVVALAMLVGCSGAERLGQIGRAPDFDPIINPTQRPDYYPINLPMPAPEVSERQANSLWRSGARAFFKDQRAARVGDILTVEIAIDDDATITNETSRSRDNVESASWNALAGYEASLAAILPEAVDNISLLDLESDMTHCMDRLHFAIDKSLECGRR